MPDEDLWREVLRCLCVSEAREHVVYSEKGSFIRLYNILHHIPGSGVKGSFALGMTRSAWLAPG